MSYVEHNIGTIRSFTQLDAWKQGHQLVLSIYAYTKKFPKDELFGLVSQMRRASVSITSNIAEGFRRRTLKEKRQFFTTSLASLTEIQNQLLISRDVQYITNDAFNQLAVHSARVGKLINGLLRSLKKI